MFGMGTSAEVPVAEVRRLFTAPSTKNHVLSAFG